MKPGLIIGHEPVGVIEELGAGVTGYTIGDRVLVGAITPCGQCHACLSGQLSQCGHGSGYEAIGGWRFGNTINGAQAEYLVVPNAQANLAKIPDDVTDDQVVLLSDIASTGISGAESGGVKIGDSVVVFAQGPIGLCASLGAKLMGAALVIGVDGDDRRLAMARKLGVDVALDYRTTDVIAEVKKLTGGGADVAIEALGTQQTFENALRVLRARSETLRRSFKTVLCCVASVKSSVYSSSSSHSPDESGRMRTAVKSAVWRCPQMSRDKRLNRTQEVIGSIPFSSTTCNDFATTALRPRDRGVVLDVDVLARQCSRSESCDASCWARLRRP